MEIWICIWFVGILKNLLGPNCHLELNVPFVSKMQWRRNLIVFNDFSPYFRVFYAFLIVLLSINLINRSMVDQRNSLLKNPVFVLSLSFIIFFIYQIIYEASFFIGSDKSVVANKIIVLFAYVNAITNVLYACTIGLIARYNYIACRNKKYNFRSYWWRINYFIPLLVLRLS